MVGPWESKAEERFSWLSSEKLKKKKKVYNEAEFFNEKHQWGLKGKISVPFFFFFSIICSSFRFAFQKDMRSFLDEFAFTSIE